MIIYVKMRMAICTIIHLKMKSAMMIMMTIKNNYHTHQHHHPHGDENDPHQPHDYDIHHPHDNEKDHPHTNLLIMRMITTNRLRMENLDSKPSSTATSTQC